MNFCFQIYRFFFFIISGYLCMYINHMGCCQNVFILLFSLLIIVKSQNNSSSLPHTYLNLELKVSVHQMKNLENQSNNLYLLEKYFLLTGHLYWEIISFECHNFHNMPLTTLHCQVKYQAPVTKPDYRVINLISLSHPSDKYRNC